MKVGIVGYNLIGKRVADAIVAQDDMDVVGILEHDTLPTKIAKLKGYVVHTNEDFLKNCDIVVNCSDKEINAPKVINTQHISKENSLYPVLDSSSNEQSVKIIEPNNIAILRIINALKNDIKCKRLFVSIIARTNHATEPSKGFVDGLVPVFSKTDELKELEQVLGNIEVYTRKVIVPYTNSNVLTIKLDFDNELTKEKAIALLKQSSRIAVKPGKQGFPDTAHVQEFYKDIGRPRFDRPEIFIWEETIIINKNSFYCIADVHPEATSIPDIIDCIQSYQVNTQ